MKEIVLNCADETYSHLCNPTNLKEWDSLKDVFENNTWLEDLVLAARRGVDRNEFLKHNKSLGHVLEHNWLKQDCERYGVSMEAHIQSMAHGHPHGDGEELKKEMLSGIPDDDPEKEYMKEIIFDENTV